MNETRTTHPSEEQLADFLHGRLDAHWQRVIEEHIEACDSCCFQLRNIPDDPLLEQVREAELSSVIVTHRSVSTPPALASDPSIPVELANHSRYEILKTLGAGGMGVVYHARHRLMERPVALKVMKPALVTHEKAIQRFQREVKAAAKLSHPNIVSAYDADQAGDHHFLVMEFVDGISLEKFVQRRGPLATARACELIRQTAMALQHAHDQGMVHRDIKPQNLMIDRTGQVKVLDFGLARFVRDQTRSPEETERFRSLTLPGTGLGTPDYISPEQALDSRTADIRSDIYSLGCTFYFLLSGQVPFPFASNEEKIQHQLSGEPVPLREFCPKLPTGLIAVIEKMMEKNPAKRFQSPQEICEALKPWCRPRRKSKPSVQPEPETKPVVPETQVQQAEKKQFPRKLWPVLVLIAGLLSAVFWWPKQEQKPVLIVLPFRGVWVPDYEPLERELMANKIPFQLTSSEMGTPTLLSSSSLNGRRLEIDVPLSEIDPQAFSGVIVIGGEMDELLYGERTSTRLQQILQAINANQRPVMGIGRGMMPLIQAGLLDGVAVTDSEYINPDLRSPKVNWKPGETVLRSGNFLTAPDWNAAPEFAEAAVEMLLHP